MNRTTIAATVALLFLSTNAFAGANARYSHCYKIKDTQAAAAYTVDIEANDFRFPDADGCTINVPAKQICVEAYDTNLNPTPAEGAPGGFNGQKYLCYKAKCPAPAAPLVVGVGDALGIRDVTVSKTKQVCIPIIQDTCVDSDDCRARQNVVTAGCGVDGFCTADTCSGGNEDCNEFFGDGCEAATADDTYNCGACNTVCDFANAYPSCTAGVCGIDSCVADYGDCDMNPGTGCEASLSSDVNNCGACNTTCSFPNATEICASSSCAIGSCDAGYADCDIDSGTGCEVFLSSDADNCGACGSVCPGQNATPVCSSGICDIGACDTGYGDCDGNPGTGCEVNVQNDPDHCGGCNIVCPGSCTAGVCNP